MKKHNYNNLKNILPSLNKGMFYLKNEIDTYYIFPDDFEYNIINITKEEDMISNQILSYINSSKNDEELINLIMKPIEFYYFIIKVQREVKLHDKDISIFH